MKVQAGMKFNIFFKLFSLFFLLMIFALPSVCLPYNLDILSEIAVERADLNNYNLNLYFNQKFKGNAFIQNKADGSFIVYIPNAAANKKGVELIYKDRHEKSNIKISIEEKPYITKDTESVYIKLHVNTKNNASIQLISRSLEDDGAAAEDGGKTFNFSSFIMLIIFALTIFAVFRIIKAAKNAEDTLNYTSFPERYSEELQSPPAETQNEQPRSGKLMINTIKPSLKSNGENSFSCFDIPLAPELKQDDFEFKSTLRQTAGILRSAKSKHTKPFKNSFEEDSSELKLPVIEHIKQQKKEEDENKLHILSELYITPDKGFYLLFKDNTFSLFGFAGGQVILLKTFSDLAQINLQARFYDKHAQNDLYIVRLDSYKAMIEISDTGMKELTVL